ncbi:MAG: 50S ribosomal protein L22 [Microgenomates group bacterium]
MEVIAKSKFLRISPRKLNLVAQAIKGLKASYALTVLKNLEKKGAVFLEKTLKQGIANAVNNYHLEKESLTIKKIEVNKGPILKRGRPVSRGRWHPILKRTSHLTIYLEGEEKKTEEKKNKKVKEKSKKGEKNGTQS